MNQEEAIAEIALRELKKTELLNAKVNPSEFKQKIINVVMVLVVLTAA